MALSQISLKKNSKGFQAAEAWMERGLLDLIMFAFICSDYFVVHLYCT